jgi:hypothetical protein
VQAACPVIGGTAWVPLHYLGGAAAPSRSGDHLIAWSAWPARVRERRARSYDREKYRISNRRRDEIRRLT